MPPRAAGAVFSILSLAALALGVALLLTPLGRLARWELAPLAAAAGAFATAVKLYPLAAFLAFLPRGGRERRHLVAELLLAGLLAAGPNLVSGAGAGPLVTLFGADVYWTNQSINGMISRLSMPLGSLPPLVPGLHVTIAMLAVTASLGAMTLAVVIARRGSPWAGCLSLLLCYAALAAPHDSLWNFAPFLLGFTWCWPIARRRPLLMALLALAWLLIELQLLLGAMGAALDQQPAWPAVRLVSSLVLFGAVILAGLLLTSARQTASAPCG
jgi:hypothetical protein